jgi:polysaccharide export outer membrane protein
MRNLDIKTLLRCVALLLVCLLVACSAGRGAGTLTADAQGKRGIDEFRLGSGDKVHVNVFGADRLGGDFTVDPTGSIYMPLIGSIEATGSTLTEFAGKIAATLRNEGMIDDPKVTVALIEARPFFIYGEVSKSGGYPYMPGMNVVSAIATAGGFTYRASEDHVYIRRNGTGGELYVDLSDPSQPPVSIYPGDIIRVPGRFF